MSLQTSMTSPISMTSPTLRGPTLRMIVEFFVKLGYSSDFLDSKFLVPAGRLVAEHMRIHGTKPPQKCLVRIDGMARTINQYDIDDLPKLFEIIRSVLDKQIGLEKCIIESTPSEAIQMTEHQALLKASHMIDTLSEATKKVIEEFSKKNHNMYNCDYLMCCSDDEDHHNDHSEEKEEDSPINQFDDRGYFRRDQLVAEKMRRLIRLKKQNDAQSIVHETFGCGRKRKSMRTSRRQRTYSGVM